jgi:hypothetical protein
MVGEIQELKKLAGEIKITWQRAGYSHKDFYTMVDDIGILLAYIEILTRKE